MGFTKVYFHFEGVSKNCDSVEKGKSFFLIGIHSMQAEQPLKGMELQEKY